MRLTREEGTSAGAVGPAPDASFDLAVDPRAYLDRLGLDPGGEYPVSEDTLTRLQRTHVRTVPFETFAITGPPFGEENATDVSQGGGPGVSLRLSALHEKIVARRRGGFCFELNGLFGWLLAAVGFGVDRVAARVISDGEARPPANHHALLVELAARDEPVLVDAGLGVPTLRQPLPLDGAIITDPVGIDWRVCESDRPDADYLVQYRQSGSEWTDRYLFTTTPRHLAYFGATCDYLTTAADSAFTGEPVASIATAAGHVTLSADTLTVSRDAETTERAVDREEYTTLLAEEFELDPALAERVEP